MEKEKSAEERLAELIAEGRVADISGTITVCPVAEMGGRT